MCFATGRSETTRAGPRTAGLGPNGDDRVRREIKLSLDEPGATDIGDLLYVQHELTDGVLDYFDQHRPGDLERRGSVLGNRLLRHARTW